MPSEHFSYTLVELEDKEKIFKEIPADMWGVFILIATNDFALFCNCKAGAEHLCRLMFGAIGMTINMWLQFMILWFVNHYIVGQAVHETQSDYKQYHEEVFNEDGSFNHTKWYAWKDGPYMSLCNLAMSKASFTVAILFMWMARMLGELRGIDRLHRDVWNIAPLPADASSADMMVTQKNQKGQIEEWHLIALNKTSRFLIYLLVILPKMCIAFILIYIGCRWLCATESFSDLILNALALEFVVSVDELVYENFAPQVLSEWLANTKIAHVRADFEEADGTDGQSAKVWAYVKSILVMGLCLVLSFYYLQLFQQVIPGFKHDIHEHCDGWFEKYYEPVCDFGTADPEACFPYGPQ